MRKLKKKDRNKRKIPVDVRQALTVIDDAGPVDYEKLKRIMDDPNFLKASLRAHRDDKLHEKFGVVQTEKGPNWLRDYLEVESECRAYPRNQSRRLLPRDF